MSTPRLACFIAAYGRDGRVGQGKMGQKENEKRSTYTVVAVVAVNDQFTVTSTCAIPTCQKNIDMRPKSCCQIIFLRQDNPTLLLSEYLFG